MPRRDLPSFRDLRAFMTFLEQRQQLLRIAEPVSAVHEMTEIHRRVLREDGPADVVWDVGDASDDDEEDDADGKNGERTPVAPHQRSERHAGEEGVGLMMDQDRDVERGIALEESRNNPVRRRRSTSSSLASSFARSSRSSSDAEGEEYGAFTDARS